MCVGGGRVLSAGRKRCRDLTKRRGKRGKRCLCVLVVGMESGSLHTFRDFFAIWMRVLQIELFSMANDFESN